MASRVLRTGSGAGGAGLTALLLVLGAAPATADSVVASRMIPAQTVLDATDLAFQAGAQPGALRDPADAIGMETRVNIYAGRPIRADDLTTPAIVERNQIVPLNYFHAGLVIATEGRALERAGAGTRIRVMNLSSRSTVIGTVMIDGSISVAPKAE